MKKKILITGCYHSLNSGVMAMAESIIQQFPTHEIFITTSDDYKKTDLVRYGIYRNVSLVDSEWLNGKGDWHKIKIGLGFFGISLFQKTKRILDQVDVIIDISGDGISSDYGTKSIFFSLYPNFLSKKKKKFIYAPQTLGPFKSGIQTFLAKRAFSNADAVYLREEESLNKIDQEQIKISAIYADLAFLLEPREIPEGANIPPNTIAVGVSSLIKKFTKEDNCNHFKEICDSCIKANYNVLLVNHVNTLQGDDIMVAKSLKEEYYHDDDRVIFFNENFRGSEWKYLIGKCEGIISARMHPVVHALAQAVPALNLSYNHKSIGVIRNRFSPYGDNIGINDNDILKKINDFILQITLVDKAEFEKKVQKNKILAKQFIEELKILL